jgi:hypothetical protein
MGIGDWGLGIGDWGLGPIPNPQSPIPIPNPQFFFKKLIKTIHISYLKINRIYIFIFIVQLKLFDI